MQDIRPEESDASHVVRYGGTSARRTLGGDKFSMTTPRARARILAMMTLRDQLFEESRNLQRIINKKRENFTRITNTIARGEKEQRRLKGSHI